MIVCLGDSLTRGFFGYSYIPWVRINDEIVNRGADGSSAANGLKRLGGCLGHGKTLKASAYVVCLGANDLLMPYLSKSSAYWRAAFAVRNSYMHYCADETAFKRVYTEILDRLITSGKRVVTVGVPLFELAGFPSGKTASYNNIIAKLSAGYGARFIDIFAAQLEHGPAQKPYSWGSSNLERLADAALMAFHPKDKDSLSEKRGLRLTVDGCHFNSLSARLLGRLVAQSLQED